MGWFLWCEVVGENGRCRVVLGCEVVGRKRPLLAHISSWFINIRFHDSSSIISAAKLIRLVIGMNLPNRKKAHIPSAKLYDYLLSPSHSVGKSKAKIFRGFGFNEDNVALLEARLLSIAHYRRRR